MTKTLIILGASEQGVLAAAGLGYKVIVLCPKESMVSARISLHAYELFFVESLEDDQEIYNVIKEIKKTSPKIELVISFTELGLKTASLISEKLNLPTNSVEVINTTRNKEAMRQKFFGNSMLRLKFKSGFTKDFTKTPPFKFPYIIKPLEGFGSKSVNLIGNEDDWDRWLSSNKSNINMQWIIEPYIKGPEYSVETISFNGKHVFLGITEKETTGSPNFVEVGHSVPADIEKSLYNKIINLTKEALDCIGMKYGPGHTEVKWNEETNEGVIIETHTRPGGDSIPLLHSLSTDIDQYELGIRSYYEEYVQQWEDPVYKKICTIKFLTYEQTGTLLSIGLQDTLKNKNIKRWELYNSIGEKVQKTTDSSSRAGYVIAIGETKEFVKSAVENFEKNLFTTIQ